jgi:hypothetical protein
VNSLKRHTEPIGSRNVYPPLFVGNKLRIKSYKRVVWLHFNHVKGLSATCPAGTTVKLALATH